MSRVIVCGDGVKWLRDTKFAADWSVVTSLPDTSEIASLSFGEWKKWFVETAGLICSRVDASSVAVFFQTDIKRDGRWVDKAFLVQKGAEAAGLSCLWHKIVCRAAPGTTTFGRPSYAHLLAFSKNVQAEPARSLPDVLPALGEMTWARAMGVSACELACRFLKTQTATKTVVDPFCGLGTALAVANVMGMDAIGVELSPKRARKAETLQVDLARSGAVVKR